MKTFNMCSTRTFRGPHGEYDQICLSPKNSKENRSVSWARACVGTGTKFWKTESSLYGETNQLEDMMIIYIEKSTATAKSLQSCPTLCEPIDGSPSESLGFSRQEHWSGLPFPSPMHEGEK
ncbi:unnamed protein product [Rangifer tarandus platyrhynchus]|uniref:Uncharacterized protein n=2 Tax=Rangifer tarandus platyrhynchus TaxID=3082113 RepID=A0AC59Z9J5_RANTA|nr:unnamed protein product [Rangifer tarandus platyrhynchus]